MKKLLFVFLLASGATALANNTDPAAPKAQEKRVSPPPAVAVPDAVPAVAIVPVKTKAIKKPMAYKANPVKGNFSTDDMHSNISRLDLSVYFVEMVNNTNLKLIKKLLED